MGAAARYTGLRPLARRIFAVILLLGALLVFYVQETKAERTPLVADLSDHLVAITTGFAGTDVLLFGATEEEGDVVVVVRGPSQPVTMHRKSRVLGIWANTASMSFARAPSFYAFAASRPLSEVAGSTELERHEIGIEHIRLELPRSKASENVAADWRSALVRTHQTIGVYQGSPGLVSFLGNRLFRAEFHLPANVPTGSYQVQVFLFKDGRVKSAQVTPLIVSKIGVQAEIFDFAHERSALYGIFAIVVALAAGWLGNALFRKA